MQPILEKYAQPERPIVRYHGGKWKLAPWIIEHLPPHRVYVEPFGGGGSVLLQKPRSYAEVYNDLDGEMVNLFMVVRDRGAELARLVELTPFARAEYLGSFPESDDPVEQARRTLIRSFMGFGSNALCRNIKSGFRSNSNRSGTTPARDWMNYPNVLVRIVERLRGVVIENKDAVEVMLQHDGDQTLHYCDPPYVHSTRATLARTGAHGHHGYNHEMDDEQHVALVKALRELRGMVVVSGYRCDLYDELFEGWQRIDCQAHADGALDRVESLWLSPNVRLSQARLDL